MHRRIFSTVMSFAKTGKTLLNFFKKAEAPPEHPMLSAEQKALNDAKFEEVDEDEDENEDEDGEDEEEINCAFPLDLADSVRTRLGRLSTQRICFGFDDDLEAVLKKSSADSRRATRVRVAEKLEEQEEDV
jgi:hypothetical protein